MDEDFAFFLLCLSLIFFFVVVIWAFSQKKAKEVETIKRTKVTDRPDLIQDDKVTVALVEQKLKEFSLQTVANRKAGFTEKDVHKQLERYLKDIFQNVTMEHGVESKTGKNIDVDVANGKVGIEVKLASEIFKEGGWDRALGQMVKYSRLKYKDGNLIFLIAGFDEDLRNSILSDFEDDAHAQKCQFVFASAGQKVNALLTVSA